MITMLTIVCARLRLVGLCVREGWFPNVTEEQPLCLVQDSSANRNSGRFAVADFDSNSDSSPSLQRSQMNPRLRRTGEKAATLDRTYPSGKSVSTGQFDHGGSSCLHSLS